MSCICRTCLTKITSNRYVDINLSEFARKQLKLCIPELNLDLVMEPVLCIKCAEALNAAYDFKSCCLHTEQRIHALVETLTIEQQNVELDAVLGNKYNGINSMAIHCGNDLNTVHDHSRTRHDVEEYKDVKEECSVTSKSCSFDEGAEVNCNRIKEECITIEEHEWLSFIKSEMFDTGSDAAITDIKTELDTKSNVAAVQSEHNYALAAVNGTAADDIFLVEPSRSDDCEEHNESSGKISRNSAGLLRQYNKFDPVNYIAKDENCNSATISAESFSKQGNSVTKNRVEVVSMEPHSSSSVRLLRQGTVNETKIADTTLIRSIRRRFNNISPIKSHSTINNLCKHANRRVHCGCCQKEKNIEEQIVPKSELHSELLRDCRKDLTKVNISSAEEILNIENYTVTKGVETHDKKSSHHLKCDMNINSNNTVATEAKANSHSVIDCSPLNLNYSNTSALNSSKTFTNVSLQHFINTNNLSVQVKNQELGISSQFLNTIGKTPYKCVRSDNASSRKGNLIKHMRNHTGEKPYKCNQCEYAFFHKSNLIIHMRKHSGEKPYKCNVCNYTSSRKCDLNVHLRTHTGVKPYKCAECDYPFPSKGNLIKHMKKHTGEKPYKCNVCNYAGYRKSDLNIHLRTHTGEKPYKCDQCEYAFSQKSNLIIHMRKHSGEKTYKCEQCDYAFSEKSKLIIHVRTHTGEKTYKCDQCDYACSEKSNLIVHLRNHTKKKTHKCNVCNYASSKKSDVTCHLRTHTGKKPYKCDQCDFACSMKGNLKRHMRQHTGEKPYKCDKCDYAFSSSGNLKTHMRKHTGEKPYKCDKCDYAFSSCSNLKEHMRRHTGEKPYKCNQCDFACSHKSNLIIHMRTHTGEKPYKCNGCNYASSQKNNLLLHLRNHTGKKNIQM